MNTLSFDPDNTLAGGLFALSPREAIRLAADLCAAVENAVGADGAHGAVWPGNITAADGLVAVGEPCSVGISDMAPDALEFVAPEQFWSGECTPASDVYSIGLVLYTALNKGVMPFFADAGEHTSEERATALQNRMKGVEMPYPATAGRELAELVRKATAFRAADRYATPGILRAALSSLSEAAGIPAAAPLQPLPETVRTYKVDKNFERTEPEKPKKPHREKREKGGVDENMDAADFRKTRAKRHWLLPVLLVLVVVAAVILLLKSCREGREPDIPVVTPPAATDAIHSPVPETMNPVQITTKPPVTAPPETPKPTPNPDPKYELFMADVTWEQARDLCEQKGGHLATVRTQEQLDRIIDLAQQNGATFVWLGAYRNDSGQWYYVTGDALDFTVWDTGEPSAKDGDGTPENYLLLWYRARVDRWAYNDMRNDPISVARNYRGKLCYVCQYDD